MEKTIKRIMLDDLDKLAIVFKEKEILDYGLVSGDKIELEDLLKWNHKN